MDLTNERRFFGDYGVPDDWHVGRFEDVALIDEHNLKADTADEFEFDYISLSDIDQDDQEIETSRHFFKTAPSRARRIVSSGDILMATVRPNLKGFTLVENVTGNLIASTGFAVLSATKCHNRFLFQFLFSSAIERQLHRLLVGSNYPAINSSDVRNLRVLLPPIAEQTAIARVLGLMDEVINKNNQLIAQKELRKKWLMQNLLSGKKRLKGFGDEWQLVRLGDVAVESNLRNRQKLDSKSLMAVTKSRGIVPMRERVQGNEVVRCKLIDKDYFAYNPMRLNIGSIARWKQSETAMVSGDYVVFRCLDGKAHPDFIDFYRQSHAWKNFVERAGDGSVRVRIYFSHLKHLRLHLPPFVEQLEIAKVLSLAESEIDTLTSKTVRLKTQKQWLMQQLLTGKKRLKVNENEEIG